MNKKLVRFIVTGLTNTFVDLSILNFLVFAFDAPNWLANTISVSTAVAVSYLLNHYFVFKSTQSHTAGHIGTFLLITLIGIFVVQDGGLYAILHWLPWIGDLAVSIVHGIGVKSLSDEFIRLNSAKAALAVLSLSWNYIMYNKIVFKSTPGKVDVVV